MLPARTDVRPSSRLLQPALRDSGLQRSASSRRHVSCATCCWEALLRATSAFLCVVFALGVPASAFGLQIAANLSSHMVEVHAGFSGAKILLFGIVEDDSEIAITIEGPNRPVLVQRRGKRFGFWVNQDQVHFSDAPGFYASATTQTLKDLALPETLRLYHIGSAYVGLSTRAPEPKRPTLSPSSAGNGFSDESFVADNPEWHEAVQRIRARTGLYLSEPQEIWRIGPQLFRAEIALPGNAPIGIYAVRIFLLRHGEVLRGQTIPLEVRKAGLGGFVSNLSGSYPAVYGLLCILLAGFVGWGTDFLFRRLF